MFETFESVRPRRGTSAGAGGGGRSSNAPGGGGGRGTAFADCVTEADDEAGAAL